MSNCIKEPDKLNWKIPFILDADQELLAIWKAGTRNWSVYLRDPSQELLGISFCGDFEIK